MSVVHRNRALINYVGAITNEVILPMSRDLKELKDVTPEKANVIGRLLTRACQDIEYCLKNLKEGDNGGESKWYRKIN